MAIKDSTDKVKNLAVGDGTPSDVDYCLRRKKNYTTVVLAKNTSQRIMIYHATKACVIKAIRMVPTATPTSTDGDYWTYTVVENNGAGGAETTVGAGVTTKATGGIGFTAGEVYEYTDVAEEALVAGQYLFLGCAATTGGAGDADAHNIVVEVEVELS